MAGRNDPCPCGSGRKYKKCCLALESAASLPPELQRALAWHQEDRACVEKLTGWIQREHPEWVAEAYDLLVAEAHAERDSLFPFYLTYLCWHYCPSDQHDDTPAVLFFRERSEWFLAQRVAWLSLWEVREADPGRCLRLADLFTGAERTVWEREGSRGAHPRQVFLARVVDLSDGVSVLAGMYPHGLALTQGQDLRKAFLKRWFPRRRKLRPDELSSDEMFVELTCAFDEACHPPPPQLANFHGEPLQWTVDRFSFPAGERDRVLDALRGLGELEGDTLAFTEDSPRGPCVTGFVRVRADSLECETNSLGRADRLLLRLGEGPWSYAGRSHPSGPELPAGPEEELPPEAYDYLRQVREQHMRAWLEDSIPALGGQTPRQAAATPRGRQQLLRLLGQFADSEARLPERQRISLDFLHEELFRPF